MKINLSTGEIVSEESQPEPESKQNDEPTFGNNLNPSELSKAIREYSEWVNDHYELGIDFDDLTIEISRRMQRAAGKAIARKKSGEWRYIMRFAWKAYKEWGWTDDWTGVIRHELVHIWEYQTYGDSGHGARFKRKARAVDAPRHCKKFTDHNYEVTCTQCGSIVAERHRRSKVVKNAANYRSGCCKAPCESQRV